MLVFLWSLLFAPQVIEIKPEPAVIINAILTAYSSSEDETDEDPWTAADGSRPRYGIVANNCLPFGEPVKIANEVFIVRDRKNKRYGCEWFDIWMPSKDQALNFGIKRAPVEIVLKTQLSYNYR